MTESSFEILRNLAICFIWFFVGFNCAFGLINWQRHKEQDALLKEHRQYLAKLRAGIGG